MKKFLQFILALLYIIILQFSTVFADTNAYLAENVDKTTSAAFENEQGDVVPPDIIGQGAVLINADTGEILFEKNMDQKMYPASMTKVMTAILALEKGEIDDNILISATAVDIDPLSSTIGMRQNEVLTLDQALNGLMISSANEVAGALAEYVSGTHENFARLMTERAKEFGAVNTNFLNASGLYDDNHYSTPYDMALIFQEGMKSQYFRELVKRLNYQIPPIGTRNAPINLVSRNKLLLRDTPYYYSFYEGGKTGFTDQSGYCLVSYAKKDDVTLVCVVMNSLENGNFTDTKELFEYGFNFFKTERIFDRYEFSKAIPVTQQNKEEVLERGSIVVQAEKGITMTLRTDILNKGFEQKVTLPDSLEAPVEKGQNIGKLEIISNGNAIGEVSLVSLDTIAKLTPEEIRQLKIDELIQKIKDSLPIILAFVPIVLLIIIVIISMIRKHRRRRKSRNLFRSGDTYKFK